MNNRLKEIRLAVGELKKERMSQPAFAKLMGAGCTRDQIANYENGRVPIPEWFIEKLEKEQNVNRQWLETGNGDMFNKLDAEQELAKAVNALLQTPEDDLRRIWVKRIANMTDEECFLFKSFIESLIGK